MRTFQRKPYLVQHFKMPLWGQAADETPPKWLINRIQSGELQINPHGGFTMATPWGVQSCIAGDIVLLNDEDGIEFCKPENFGDYFEVIDPKEMLRAA